VCLSTAALAACKSSSGGIGENLFCPRKGEVVEDENGGGALEEVKRQGGACCLMMMVMRIDDDDGGRGVRLAKRMSKVLRSTQPRDKLGRNSVPNARQERQKDLQNWLIIK
jgi:hypothetical protein